AVMISLFTLGIGEFVFDRGLQHDLSAYVSVWAEMNDFSSGVVDLRRLTFDATLVVVPLFVTVRAVGGLRWGLTSAHAPPASTPGAPPQAAPPSSCPPEGGAPAPRQAAEAAAAGAAGAATAGLLCRPPRARGTCRSGRNPATPWLAWSPVTSARLARSPTP